MRCVFECPNSNQCGPPSRAYTAFKIQTSRDYQTRPNFPLNFMCSKLMNSFLPLWDARVFVFICWVCVLLCLATSTFCYLKIYWMLRKPHVRVQVRGNLPWVQQNRTFRMSMVKFKKSVSAVLWVHVVLVACYTPFTVLNLRLSLSSDMNANSKSAGYWKVLFHHSCLLQLFTESHRILLEGHRSKRDC